MISNTYIQIRKFCTTRHLSIVLFIDNLKNIVATIKFSSLLFSLHLFQI